MARVVFVPDRSYANQAALNTQLGGMGITLLATTGLTQADVWAHQWAQTNGVPWISRSSFLDGAGHVDPGSRSAANLRTSNPDTVLTAGTGAHVTSAVALAKVRGHTLSQI